MKRWLGLSLCAFTLCVTAIAQQPGETRQPDQNTASGVRPAGETLMKSQEPFSQDQLRKNESAVRTMAISPDEFQKLFDEGKVSIRTQIVSFIVINGAVYTSVGGVLFPMPGGGASGCFSVPAENEARIGRARAEWAERLKRAEATSKEKKQ